MADNDKCKRFWRGTPPKSRGDYAFITHTVETMNATDGRIMTRGYDSKRAPGGAVPGVP